MSVPHTLLDSKQTVRARESAVSLEYVKTYFSISSGIWFMNVDGIEDSDCSRFSEAWFSESGSS